MQTLVLFLVLVALAGALFISGAYLIGGLGPALLTGGACSAAAAAFLRRGMMGG
jgi:hypothetical protein